MGSRGSRYNQHAKYCQNLSVAKILRFFNFTKRRPVPSWISTFVKFNCQTVSRQCLIIVLHVVKIGHSDAEILQFFKLATATILDFWILLTTGVQRVKMHQHAKFRQNRSIGCEDINIFWFFKMATVRHLGFVLGIFGPPTVSTWESLSLCKIWLWSMQ